MLGLDRAAVWVDLEVDADLVIIGIKKYFKNVQPKKLSGRTQTFLISEKNINEIRVREKPLSKTMIKIDFSYSRYNKKDNLYPLTSEIAKVMAEEEIVDIINKISLSHITRGNLKYEYLEICIQENVKSFYDYHNVISLFYKSLSRNFKTFEKTRFENYDVAGDYFYSTGFIFQLDIGWKMRLYSKSHEHNKKHPGESLHPILRLEHRVTSGILKKWCSTKMVKDFTIEFLKNEIVKQMGHNLVIFLEQEIDRDIEFLEDKFKEFTSKNLKTLVRDYQEHILDEQIINYVVTKLSTKCLRQKERYRQKVKLSLEEFQARGSPKRNNFNNIKRLEFFIREILLIDIEVKCSYTEHLTFNIK